MDTFSIAIKSLDDTYREFEETYEALRQGKPADKHQGTYFTSLDAVRRILTQERLALLRAIREREPESIYALARSVGRDLRNVQDDLELLRKHGLVRFRNREGDKRGAKIPEVPFDEIDLTVAIARGKAGANKFIEDHLQHFLAPIAITPSTVMGEAIKWKKKGLRKAVIDFLSYELRVSDFVDTSGFGTVLDGATERLEDFADLSWGLARKCLNIFLRDATYNHYARRRYGLAIIEPLLEVPLDGNVEKGIRRDVWQLKRPVPPLPEKGSFPKGTFSIEELKSRPHEKYQKAAARIAHELYHTNRVNLDLLYFPRVQTDANGEISTHTADPSPMGK